MPVLRKYSTDVLSIFANLDPNNNSDPTLRYTVEKIVMKKVEKSLKHWYSTGTGKTLFVLRFLNGSLRVSFLNLRFFSRIWPYINEAY